jgi:hypothetical protein
MSKAKEIISETFSFDWAEEGMELSTLGLYVKSDDFERIVTGLCAEIEALEKANESEFNRGIEAGRELYLMGQPMMVLINNNSNPL